MENIAKIIGSAIRKCRINRKISQIELASRIHKSKSTLSKYEKGEISIDVETLSEIADVLNVPPAYFFEAVSIKKRELAAPAANELPEFFRQKKVYMYFWDARMDNINRSVLILESPVEDNANCYHAFLYMNVRDYTDYYLCENPYMGRIEFHQMLTSIHMTHRNTDLEHIMIVIPENFADTGGRWGLFSGISFRPVVPVAIKVFFSKTPLDITPEFIADLHFSKEDIKKMRANNYLSVWQKF